jgi:hypothetical protein
MSYVGQWRIVETSAWDTDYLDESEDACVEFTRDSGTMTFGYIYLEMDVAKEQIGNADILGYSFVGNDEDHEVSGWDWFHQTESKDEMEGKIYFHYGDNSGIRIVR